MARPIDLDGDGSPEILLATAGSIQLWTSQVDGTWAASGLWNPYQCYGARARTDVREALRNGEVRPVAPAWPDLEIAGVRAGAFERNRDCSAASAEVDPAP